MQTHVLEYFEATVERIPDKIAVVDRDQRTSFSMLRRQALRLAARLSSASPAPNQPIAILLPKSTDAVVSLLAILYSGNFYVPLDVRSPASRLHTILTNLSPSLVITNRAMQDRLASAGWPPSTTVLSDDVPNGPVPREEAWTPLRFRVLDVDPVYIIYTSGSTGIPKGVVIPHRAVIDYIDWARGCYAISEHDIIGNQAPFFFDNSTLDIYLCFSCGSTLVLIPEELFAFPLRLIEFVRAAAISTVFWVPSVLTNVATFKVLDIGGLPLLTKILFAGEVMPTRTLNYWKSRCPQALFSNLYGPTEITVDCTYYIVERDFENHESLPIGVPCRNTDILVLNEQNELATPGEVGELCVRGSSLALGYWNAPDKTAVAFVQNPLNPHYPERLYRTGDLVFWNDRHEIMFVGRKDFQVKHQGYRIELGEIEAAVLSLAEIGNACVMYNEAEKQITLFYEARASVTPAALRRLLSERLATYMLPTSFHEMQALPLTANGKIDRTRLANRYFAKA